MGLQDDSRGEAMTEDNIPHLEIHVKHGDYNTIVRGTSWLEVLTQARVASTQMKIAELTCKEVTYDFTENRWNLQIPREIRPARNRIACALLLTFPTRISREVLEILSSVDMASLRNYLTNPDFGVQPNIDENDEGIILNERGYKWANEVLESIEDNDEEEVELGEDA
jgi:hypothetical protein